MTHKFTNPAKVHTPPAPFSHSVEVPAGERTLYVSGQIGRAPDGTLPASIAGQTDQVFQNIAAVLAASGFAMADVVSFRIFLVGPDNRQGFSMVRNKHLGEHRPASTLVFVSGLASPDVLVEVETVAAKA